MLGRKTCLRANCRWRHWSPPVPRKRNRNLGDRFGIQNQGRKRQVLTLLTDSFAHQVVSGRSLANDCWVFAEFKR